MKRNKNYDPDKGAKWVTKYNDRKLRHVHFKEVTGQKDMIKNRRRPAIHRALIKAINGLGSKSRQMRIAERTNKDIPAMVSDGEKVITETKGSESYYNSKIDCIAFFDENPHLTFMQMDNIKRSFRLYHKGQFLDDIRKMRNNLDRMEREYLEKQEKNG